MWTSMEMDEWTLKVGGLETAESVGAPCPSPLPFFCLPCVFPVYTPIHLPSPSCIHLADHLYLSLARLSICPDAWSVFHHL